MANKKGLKPKDIERMNVLIATHPGDKTPELEKEQAKLEKRLAEKGLYSA